MKFTVIAIAASFALVSLPALAADQAATGKPVQLAQKVDKDAKAKAGKEKSKTTAQAPKNNMRSNKGGAARGDTRSDQVQDMKKSKQ